MEELDCMELDHTYKALVDSAFLALENSYSPYSGIRVGAALLMGSGETVTGVNVENAAYGDTICAERAALLRAYAMGKRDIKAIAIVADGRNLDPDDPVTPCGSCRQMLHEAGLVSGTDILVIMCSPSRKKAYLAHMSELLPLPFPPRQL